MKGAKEISQYVFQLSVALILGYFGLLAISNPDLQTALWVSPGIARFLEKAAPLNLLVFTFGALQLAVAVLLALRRFEKIALIASIIIFSAVILNLGANEVAFRDAVILAGIVYLYYSKSDF